MLMHALLAEHSAACVTVNAEPKQVFQGSLWKVVCLGITLVTFEALLQAPTLLVTVLRHRSRLHFVPTTTFSESSHSCRWACVGGLHELLCRQGRSHRGRLIRHEMCIHEASL